MSSKCRECGGYGMYNAGTFGSCRDDGDGWRYCDCEAGALKAINEGGTCWMMGRSGERLLKAGKVLTPEQYDRYKDGCKFMKWNVLPNNA